MNRVAERCKKESCAKFHFAAKRMFAELKYIKLFLYLLNVVPVVICFLPASDETVRLICSCVSFGFTLINLVGGALMSNYKEKAIMEHQLYEATITGSSFSKTEYDRECTNELQELAIRKGLPAMKKIKNGYPVSNVPQEITDDYSYLYLCRISAAKIKFLLSRVFYGYVLMLIGIAIALIAVNFNADSGYAIYTLVCCWSLITPLITNCVSSQRCIRQCSKICADIDNFFADGDLSVERLARFYYYVQNIEFEMLLNRTVIYNFVQFIFKRGTNALSDGVTKRFMEAILELKQRNLMLKGVISQPRGKGLITSKDYDLEYLKKKEKKLKDKKKAKKAAASAGVAVPEAKPEAPVEEVKVEAPAAEVKPIEEVKPAPVKKEEKTSKQKKQTKPAPEPGKKTEKPASGKAKNKE